MHRDTFRRDILGLTIITVAMIVALTAKPSQASGSTVRCPCNLEGALSFAKGEVARFKNQQPLGVQSCDVDEDRKAAYGSTDFCRLEFEAERDTEDQTLTYECGYEVICPTDTEFVDGDGPLFILKSEKNGITGAQWRACKRDIGEIASQSHVTCVTPP